MIPISLYFVGMRYILFYILFFSLLFTGCSSTGLMGFYNKNDSNYKEFLGEGETEIYTRYQYTVSEKAEGGFVYREFFPETRTITLEAHFSDRELKNRDGPYFVWFDNGLLKESGQYQDNKLTGKCELFSYDGGLPELKSNYDQGIPHGIWEFYYSDGTLRRQETYVSGVKEGPFIEYDSFGNIRNEGVYKADTILSQVNAQSVDPSQILDSKPEYCNANGKHLCGTKRRETPKHAWSKFINTRLRYPTVALNRKVQGRALVRFLVDADGSIENIEVLHGLCASITTEVERLVRLSSPWHPGMRNGEPIPVTYYLPITFKINEGTFQ